MLASESAGRSVAALQGISQAKDEKVSIPESFPAAFPQDVFFFLNIKRQNKTKKAAPNP